MGVHFHQKASNFTKSKEKKNDSPWGFPVGSRPSSCGISAEFTVFTNSCFCSLNEDDNGIDFNNVHFETHFQKFAFSGPFVNETSKCIKPFPF